jgi:uncharacterized protein (TIGR00290 family)
MKEKVILSWSGGKDSALALYGLVQSNTHEMVALLTTLTEDYDRISMHGVREELLTQQTSALRYPLHIVYIPKNCSDEEYGRRMRAILERYQSLAVNLVAFGDVFLEDVRAYREERLARLGMQAIFPNWGIDSAELAKRFIRLGFKAVVTCVDTEALPGSFVGREYDQSFLAELPPAVDLCGERGEFHTFVYDGPVFSEPVRVRRGEKVLRDNRFYYCDLLGGDSGV